MIGFGDLREGYSGRNAIDNSGLAHCQSPAARSFHAVLALLFVEPLGMAQVRVIDVERADQDVDRHVQKLFRVEIDAWQPAS